MCIRDSGKYIRSCPQSWRQGRLILLQSQLTKGNNGLVKKKYITFGIEAVSYTHLMKNEIEAMIMDITTTTAEAEDYTGEDGLLYLSLIHILYE